MLVVTTPEVANERIAQTLGQAFGVVVRSRGIGGNIVAGLRAIVGGEINEYTQMLEEARRHAVDRLVANAALMGADAVVMMRFDSSEIGETMTEVVAYGTAVRLAPQRAAAAAPEATAAAYATAASSAVPQTAPAEPAAAASPTFGHRTHAP